MKGRLIGTGRTADVYEYGEDKVIKLFHERVPKADIAYEYDMSVKLSELPDLTPEVYGIEEIDGRTGIIFEKLTGGTMLDEILREPFKLRYYSRKLAGIQCRFHGITNMALRSIREVLRDTIIASIDLDKDEKEKILDILKTLRDGDSICHGDFHPDNVMIAGSRYCVTDWMTAARGNRCFDSARTYIILRYSVIPGEISIIKRISLNIMRNYLAGSYLKSYLIESGEERSDVERWILPVAAVRIGENIPAEEKKKLRKVVRKRTCKI